jgi:hypothetical protein
MSNETDNVLTDLACWLCGIAVGWHLGVKNYELFMIAVNFSHFHL